jgi:hypothetical protein
MHAQSVALLLLVGAMAWTSTAAHKPGTWGALHGSADMSRVSANFQPQTDGQAGHHLELRRNHEEECQGIKDDSESPPQSLPASPPSERFPLHRSRSAISDLNSFFSSNGDPSRDIPFVVLPRASGRPNYWYRQPSEGSVRVQTDLFPEHFPFARK